MATEHSHFICAIFCFIKWWNFHTEELSPPRAPALPWKFSPKLSVKIIQKRWGKSLPKKC
uniref:Uncharacterized protein n=1 Tax=Anguilla anguilla TaxID=7936 RepID=A0A0E9TYB3_ANGAN